MSEIERIAGQLKRAFEGGARHGPSVLEILVGITAQQAAARNICLQLHGIVQHDLYHAGQIALLKKALLEGVTK
jgi:hypothetical protein